MKPAAFIVAPLAFMQKNNIVNNKQSNPVEKAGGVLPSKYYTNMVSSNRNRGALSYSDDKGNSDYMDEFNKDKEFIRRSEKYSEHEMYFAFTRRNWGKINSNYKDGANPNMSLKNGNDMAHLISNMPFGNLLTSAYNNSIATIAQMSESGYDFDSKDEKGRDAFQIAKDRGNEELIKDVRKIKYNQMKVPTDISELNRRLYTITSQTNPGKIARTMAVNYLKAGANVDEGVPYRGTTINNKMGNGQYLDSLNEGYKNTKDTIMDKAQESWDSESYKTFEELSHMAKEYALKSTERLVYLGQNTSALGMNKTQIPEIDEMNKQWDDKANSFINLAQGQNKTNSISR